MREEVTGEKTSRTWRCVRDIGHGFRWEATDIADGSPALVHCCSKEPLWDDELARVRHAVALAGRPKIVAAAITIRQLIDEYDQPNAEPIPGDHEPIYGAFWTVWEWGDRSLHEFFVEPDDKPTTVADAVEVNVGAALDVLHSAGLVHCDVAPNNVLRVGGEWKLADLDGCTRRGDPMPARVPREPWRHPEHVAGMPAREEFDRYGLDAILRELRTSETTAL